MTHLKNSFIYRPYRISFSEKKLVQGQRESPPVSSSACQAPLCTLKSNSTWNLRRQARRERGQRPTRPAATRPRQSQTTMGDVPTAITTAHLLLRGLVPSLLGCPVGEEAGGGVRASAFQMTYRKDLPKLGVEGASTMSSGSSDIPSPFSGTYEGRFVEC